VEAPLNMANEWDERYRTGETPWEKGKAHPALVEFVRLQSVYGRVLVPGCGHGHDVRALAASADEVIGLDIAEGAIEAANSYPVVGGETFVLGDLFDLPARLRHRFDWVFEHTCFCAINPDLRPDYVRAVCGALLPGGHVLAIFFLSPEMDPGESGPPFGTTAAELDALFAPYFTLVGEWEPSATYPGREGRELCRLLRLKG
jgi:SAM-dependent methyltransferase